MIRGVGVRRRQFDWPNRPGSIAPSRPCSGSSTPRSTRSTTAPRKRAWTAWPANASSTAATAGINCWPSAAAFGEHAPDAPASCGPSAKARRPTAISLTAGRPTTGWRGSCSGRWTALVGARSWTTASASTSTAGTTTWRRAIWRPWTSLSRGCCGSPIISSRSAARTACCRWRTSASRTVWIDHTAYQQQRHKQCAFNLYAAAMLEHALAPLARCAATGQRADELARRGRETSGGRRAAVLEPRARSVRQQPSLARRREAAAALRPLAGHGDPVRPVPRGNTAASLRALVDCPAEMGLSYPCNACWRFWALARLGGPTLSSAISASAGRR